VGTVLEKPSADGCFLLSMPGLMLALTMYPSYWSRGTVVSDLIIVTVNTAIYAVPVLLLLGWIRKRRVHKQQVDVTSPYHVRREKALVDCG